MSVKTYVLLDALNSSAPIYQHVGDGKRVQLTKIQNWSPYLRITYQDKEGHTKTIRYKEALPTIDQTKQIKEFETPANIGWTTRERSDMVFKLGTLTTNKPNVQNYLENYPAFDKFEGFSDDHRTPCYKLLDLEADAKVLNTEIRTRVKAANKVLNMNLEGKQELLLRLNGSFFTPPKIDMDCENMLMEMMDDMDESGLNEVLRDELTTEESVSILIGKLVSAGELSFNKSPNQISKKVNGSWVDVRPISSEYTQEERNRYFIEFLTSDSGEALLADLRKSVDKMKPIAVTAVAEVIVVENKEPVVVVEPSVVEPAAPKETEPAAPNEAEPVKQGFTELEKAELALKEAKDSKVHYKTVEKLQRVVDELKSNS